MAISIVSTSNPDSASIANKEQIDISLSLSDVSASGYQNVIKTNYSVTSQIVTVQAENSSESNLYYTPIYKEKLNYNVWLSRINKNFDELD